MYNVFISQNNFPLVDITGLLNEKLSVLFKLVYSPHLLGLGAQFLVSIEIPVR